MEKEIIDLLLAIVDYILYPSREYRNAQRILVCVEKLQAKVDE